MPQSDETLPPASLRVRLSRDVLVRDEGRLLAGGAPFRLLRLSETGAGHARHWMADGGDLIGSDLGARALARRLLDHGLLVSEGCPSADEPGPQVTTDVDVIVPVHDRTEQLARCLAALAETGAAVTVVDDGSSHSGAIAQIADRHGATLMRLDVNGGPAAARNAGLRATSRPFVAFVDSDVMVAPACLGRLLEHFADPLVAIAAPRVFPAYPHQPGWVAGYENAHSSLDRGAVAGNVGPGCRVPYVISAAMLTRRTAIGSGFVEALKSGEDVDLGWRAAAAGWRVVYDPKAVVRHEHRVRLRPLLRKRWTYGRSIGPLAQRHPGSLSPLRASAITVGALATAVSGRPTTAAALLTGRGLQLGRQLHGNFSLAASVAARDIWFTAIGSARAVRRAWAPPLLLAAPYSRHVRRILLLAWALRLVEEDHLPPRYLPLAALDDLVAALALWSACFELRIVDPLVPRLHA